MNEALIWITKLFLSHLLTDFILQPGSWIQQRKEKHFAAPFLYLHGFVTAVVAWCFMGLQYWLIAIIIFVTHTIIDGWKSYRPEKVKYFLIDQLLHLIVLTACWLSLFFNFSELLQSWKVLQTDSRFWIIATAFVFLSFPAGILIGRLTKKWRDQIQNAEGLADAGKWIGVLERTIILILILKQQYEVIGLLIAAKSILRFNEKDRQEAKTEYVVIGSLISIGLSIVTGIIVNNLT